MTSNECYAYLEEVYGEAVAVDLCNFFDSTVLTEFVEFLKQERGE